MNAELYAVGALLAVVPATILVWRWWKLRRARTHVSRLVKRMTPKMRRLTEGVQTVGDANEQAAAAFRQLGEALARPPEGHPRDERGHWIGERWVPQ